MFRRRHPYTPEPLAYFLTWTTYGSWLPGDARGWTDQHGWHRTAEPVRAANAAQRRVAPAVTLAADERHVVEATIRRHCRLRGWHLHALECRTQHVHVVVTAAGLMPETVLGQLKAWCTAEVTHARRVAGMTAPPRMWTRGGSCRRLYDDRGVADTTTYVRECQTKSRE